MLSGCTALFRQKASLFCWVIQESIDWCCVVCLDQFIVQ